MVALVASTLLTIVLTALIPWYARRRPLDQRMTWGEALFFSTYVFFLMYLAFGTVPHHWLTWAENEQNWTAASLFDAGGLLTAQSQGGWFPFEITYRVISDSIAALIYIVALGVAIWLWADWQNRGQKSTKDVVPASTYGRPLVKKG